MPWFSKFLLKAAVVIVLVNLGGLWATVYIQGKHLQLLDQDQLMLANSIDSSSMDDRFEAIELKQTDFTKDLDSLDKRVNKLSTGTGSSGGQTGSSTITTAKKSTEYSLYVGSGSTNQRDWTTIPAASITIDTSKYRNIQAVYFEAGLATIGGEVYARLINTGSGLINYSSQLMHNTPTATWKTTKINLDNGENTYAVQLRSSSGETVNLTGARIRIIAE